MSAPPGTPGKHSATRFLPSGPAILLAVLVVFLVLTLARAALWLSTLSAPADHRFERAVLEARGLGVQDVYDGLIAVEPGNDALAWDTRPGAGERVLVAAWTDWRGYAKHTGKACRLGRAQGIWVTAVPQLESFCRRIAQRGDALDARLREYLGLPPDASYDQVVELWVQREDLFRPCADPEIDDRECEVGLPAIPIVPAASTDGDAADADAADESWREPARRQLAHLRWFAAQMKSLYSADAAPWTRLGYTYDWGNPISHVGASEFVVRDGAVLWIASVTPIAAYCAGALGPQARKPLAEKPSSDGAPGC